MAAHRFNSKYPISRMAQPLVVFTDFDGTITNQDSIKLLLRNFGNEKWTDGQEQIDLGKINEFKGLELLLNCLNIDFREVLKFIRQVVKVDNSFFLFSELLKSIDVPLYIVSSGSRQIIAEMIPRVEKLVSGVYSYDIEYIGGEYYVKNSTGIKIGSHVNFKEAIVDKYKSDDFNVIYIGDGLSDFAAGTRADVLFARGALAEKCTAAKVSYRSFRSFNDINSSFQYIFDKFYPKQLR